MNEEKVEKSLNSGDKINAGLFIPAGLFLGMAYGFYSGNVVGGIAAGLGIGFLLLLITNIFYSTKQ